MFDIVTRTMGCQATWMPVGETEMQTANVLYKDPTEKEDFDLDYSPLNYKIEYRFGIFDGLKASVDKGTEESINVFTKKGLITFIVKRVSTIKDGDTLIAYLVKKKN